MPPRKVDERKTRKALSKLRRAVDTAEAAGDAAKLSDWEKEFAQSVEKRLETFGSAFTDPSKGALDEPLSARQAAKLTEIGAKARGRGKGLKRSGPIKPKPGKPKPGKPKLAKPKATGGAGGFKRKSSWTPRSRDIADDLPIEDDEPPKPAASSASSGPAKLRVIKGGRGE